MATTLHPLTPTAPLVLDRDTDDAPIRSFRLPDRFDVHVTSEFVEETSRYGRPGTVAHIDAREVRHIDLAGMTGLSRACEQLEAAGVTVRLEPSTAVVVAYELVDRPLPTVGTLAGALR